MTALTAEYSAQELAILAKALKHYADTAPIDRGESRRFDWRDSFLERDCIPAAIESNRGKFSDCANYSMATQGTS